MDEFFSYHALFCMFYPGNKLNTFREGCAGYDLRFLTTGLQLSLRSGDYIGSLQGWIYFPLFFVWRTPMSARLMGMLYLLTQALCTARLTRIKPLYVFSGFVLFFPYAFQHLVDTGPFGLHATAVFLFFLLFRKWFETQKFWYPLLGAVLFFLCFWLKLVFFWLVPGIALCFALEAWDHRATFAKSAVRKRLLKHFAMAACIAVLLSGTYLLSGNVHNPKNFPLIRQLTEGERLPIGKTITDFWDLKVTQKLVHPLQTTHRIFVVKQSPFLSFLYTALTYLSIPLLLVLLIFTHVPPKRIVRAALLYGAFLLTFFFIANTKKAIHMHHAVLALPFFLLSTFETLAAVREARWKVVFDRNVVRVAVVIFSVLALFNAYWYFVFPTQRIQSQDDPSKGRVNELLRDHELAEGSIYVAVDWGMYYYQALYGDGAQAVAYESSPIQNRARLEKTARQSGRKLILLYKNVEGVIPAATLQKAFGYRRCEAIPATAVWQIMGEETAAFRRVCGAGE